MVVSHTRGQEKGYQARLGHTHTGKILALVYQLGKES